jgi:hypothetical protein
LPRIAVSRGKCVPISCLAQSIAESLKKRTADCHLWRAARARVDVRIGLQIPSFSSFISAGGASPPSVIPSEEIVKQLTARGPRLLGSLHRLRRARSPRKTD